MTLLVKLKTDKRTHCLLRLDHYPVKCISFTVAVASTVDGTLFYSIWKWNRDIIEICRKDVSSLRLRSQIES